jgi:hypothetical protein
VPDHLDPSFLKELPLAHAAVEFAEERHGGQRRRSDGAPFVLHPLEVASLLHRSGYPDHVVAAAVLHDVLEDTDTERSQLEARFGRQVSDLVAAVSDDPAIAGEGERKEELRRRVRREGGYAAALYAADKISKVRELRGLVARGLPEPEASAKRERYLRALATVEEVLPGSRLAELLRFELETLDALPPAAAGEALQEAR